jgi:uncharacterized protein (TIGR03437 family)
MRRWTQFPILLAWLASSAFGYYHFIHYPSRSGPYTPIYAKFDLSALVNKTVYFYVSDQVPNLAPTDSYEALIGQVRQALAVWNGVSTSDLRVGFGGITNIASYQPRTAGAEIVFDDLPPGVLGLGGPATLGAPANGFIPIIRSRVILPRDLSDPSRTSASQSFFTSLVHEIGHALGLQHTMAGSAMSMEPTRSTSRAQPLGADDVAAISLLYPAPAFNSAFGSITGRVTTPDGQGLNLISVVAIDPGGVAVGAFTAPDGTYRINGLPSGSYLVYAHPLPPSSQPGLSADNIVLPVDDTGTPFNAAGPVETQFFGGVKNPAASTPVVVNAGASSDGVNFQLAPRPPIVLYDVTTYSFPGNNAPAIFPAFLNTSSGAGRVVAFGQGLAANVSNVTVGVLGGGVQIQPGSPFPYPPAPAYTEIDLAFNPATGGGPRHLVFSLGGDIYVRPGAVELVSRPAPLVRRVQAQTDGSGNASLILSGDNFAPDSRVYFDGVRAAVLGFDPATGNLQVTPPPGPAGRQAVITVDNSDGQSSVFVQPSSPATYSYSPGPAASLAITPAVGPAGRDVMVDIQGINTNFADGQTVVGFGTPDIVTRQVWVLSPTHLLAVISISPQAAQSAATVTVVSGSQIAILTQGFTVTAAAPLSAASTTPILSYQGLVNSASSMPRVAPGSLASLFGVNLSLASPAVASLPLPTTLGGTTVTLNGAPIPLLAVTPGQINLQLPFDIPTGPAILRVNNGVETSQPMVVQIDAFAPGLFRAFSSAGGPVDANNPAKLGDTIVLYGTGLGPVTPPVTAGAPSPLAITNSNVHVNVAGVDLQPSYAGLTPGSAGVYQVNVPLPANMTPNAAAQVYITINGQSSNSLTIALRAP